MSKEQEDINKAIKISEQESKYGVNVVDVPGDGNCFYHAVTDQLKQNGLLSDLDGRSLTSQELRAIAAEHIQKNPQLYDDATLEAGSSQRPEELGGPLTSRESYLAAHAQEGEYADEIIKSALSRELKLNLVVISAENQKPIIQKNPAAKGTLYLYYDDNHYQSCEPKKDSPEFANLQKMVLDNPLDEVANKIAPVSDQLFTASQLGERNQNLQIQQIQENQASLDFIKKMPLSEKLEHIQAFVGLELQKGQSNYSDLQQSVDENLKLIFSRNDAASRHIRSKIAANLIDGLKSGEEAHVAIKNLVESVKKMHSAVNFAHTKNYVQQASNTTTDATPSNSQPSKNRGIGH